MDTEGAKLLAEWNEKMKTEKRIPLWEKGKVTDFKTEYGQEEPSIVAFYPPNWFNDSVAKSAVLVCAGGGYEIKAPHEGWPICEWLNANGIAAFMLDYRLNPYLVPVILNDAKRAMRTIRYHAKEWQVNPEKIGILGFSAGGGITVSLATLFDEGNPDAEDPVDKISCRPNVQVPCYPAISLIGTKEDDQWTSWVTTLFGERVDDSVLRSYSAECNVKENTPPAFLWGTCDDFLYLHWPPYLAALKEKNISFESHIYSNGPHGMGLAKDHDTACSWPERCIAWLKSQGF